MSRFTDDKGFKTSLASAAVPVPATACPADTDWCAAMTVGRIGGFLGFGPGRGAIDDATIERGGETWSVGEITLFDVDNDGIFEVAADRVSMTLGRYLPQGSVIHLGDTKLTANAESEVPNSLSYSWALPAGLSWSEGEVVTVAVRIARADVAATGSPAIAGAPQVGATVQAQPDTIADENGLPATFPDDYTFRWIRTGDGVESPIPDETGPTYTPTADDLGKRIRVEVSFTDTEGNPETRTSAEWPARGYPAPGIAPAKTGCPGGGGNGNGSGNGRARMGATP